MDRKRAISVKGKRYATDASLSTPELLHISDLLKTFGCTAAAPKSVLNTISKRYETLDQIVVELSYPTDVVAWVNYTKAIHRFLFSDLMTFAGTFRQASDPDNGRIFFGGQHHRENKPRFEGIAAGRIEEALEKAFTCLIQSSNPTNDAIFFYWRWSRIHPFYDLNGRIARILVMIFLYHYDKEVNWTTIDQKHGKFMKKLNDCHLHELNNHLLPKYLNFLYQFWSPHVLPYRIETGY